MDVRPQRYLFVSGCPRSGTTVMATLLNWNDSVLIGQERYATLLRTHPERFGPGLFEPARMLDFRAGDCGYDSFQAMKEYSAHYANPKDFGAIDSYPVRGDKITHLYQDLARFDEPDWADADVTVVHMIRNIEDVACSYETRRLNEADGWRLGYEAAITDWCESVESVYGRLEAGTPGLRIGIVEYEAAFEGDLADVSGMISRVYAFAGLDFGDKQEEGVRKIHKASAFFRQRRKLHANVLDGIRSALPADVVRKYEYIRARGI